MPFKSEKQRRFLWATRPDIAKRWAHEYPKKKKLPMYADSKEKEGASRQTTHSPTGINNLIYKAIHQMSVTPMKTADSKQEYVDIPQSGKPTYAGEERANGTLCGGEVEMTPNTDSGVNTNKKRENAINSLLQKISTVIAPVLRQKLEEAKARQEGREALRLPQNLGIKKYPVSAIGIPPPMGMTQQAQPAQAQTQRQPANSPTAAPPVGKGGNPMTNPIQSFGAISANNNLNGNAAFGAKNSPLSSKAASAIQKWAKAAPVNKNTPCSCGCGDTVATCKCSADCKCRKPGGSCYKSEKKAAGLFGALGRAAGSALGRSAGKAVGSLAGMTRKMPAAATAAFKMPAKPTAQDLLAYGKQIGYGEKLPRYTHQEFANYQLMKQRIAAQQAATTAARPAATIAARPTPAATISTPTAAAKPITPRPATPTQTSKPVTSDLSLDDLSLDEDIIAGFGKSSGSSPAWQRSAGKNEEGGLNAKGRASYNRETGGNLKAPVTEKNPSGERGKRQNSFCSRMCGMKRVNTGSKTKADPDSRINKALRKWNCRCS